MKLTKSVHAFDVLSQFLNEKLPIKTAYKITKNLISLQTDKDFYEKEFRAILQQYLEYDENGQPIPTPEGGWRVKEGKLDECQIAIQDLENIDSEVLPIKFTIEELETLNLTPNEVYSITDFIED